ncbi:MmgE/PrpD family protein [Cupriavidus basilensis]|uniref:MmgE/PrpD family protein n=1 Tax=Cupriavidus basilensis TaxID=68895 RepID=UPI0020A63D79|nr:MmgE/PrpD family protein [Cupriavidus basilensis]MCP3020576.1 MmgE/PrpD family protein [Cupriavidus basilensis]MDR3382692.1 MmgE/PrpD family protein [Cupriavidus basilensis]
MSQATDHTYPTRQLCEFLARFTLADVPAEVVERTKDLFLDWIASAIAGKDAPAVRKLQEFVAAMGPQQGPAEVLVDRRRTSPYFAALINGASSHVVEQDDVHNGSVLHPAAVVFPAVIAAAQAEGKSGAEVLLASIAGYEAGIRIGEFMGRSHYRVFHTTGTVGTLAAAAAVAKLYGMDAEGINQALGSAGTQAAGLWEFLRDAADSKQLHTAKAAADGLMSAWIARAGFTGAKRILEGPQGMAAGMSSDANPAALTDGLGERWATAETSFKFFASCRHTHPAADALKDLMLREKISADQIASVTAHVHQGAIDVLGPVTDPKTIHQAKFSMGTVLGLVAVHAHAGLGEFEDHALQDAKVAVFRDKVEMELDDEINAAYPRQWIGRVTVRTTDGRTLAGRVDVPKGDPGNTLSRPELEAKALQLGAFRHGASEAEMRTIIARVWALEKQANVNDWLPTAK